MYMYVYIYTYIHLYVGLSQAEYDELQTYSKKRLFRALVSETLIEKVNVGLTCE